MNGIPVPATTPCGFCGVQGTEAGAPFFQGMTGAICGECLKIVADVAKEPTVRLPAETSPVDSRTRYGFLAVMDDGTEVVKNPGESFTTIDRTKVRRLVLRPAVSSHVQVQVDTHGNVVDKYWQVTQTMTGEQTTRDVVSLAVVGTVYLLVEPDGSIILTTNPNV